MEEEIKQIIEKNLPKHIGEVLSKRLKEGDEAIAYIKSVNKIRENLENENAQLKKLNNEFAKDINTLAVREAGVAAREKAVLDRENRQSLIEMEAKHNYQRVEDHKEMVRLVFRNTEVRESILHTKSEFGNKSGKDQNGVFGTVESHSKDHKEEKTVTKSAE